MAALLRAGADPSATVGGMDALAVAEAGGHREVAALLRGRPPYV